MSESVRHTAGPWVAFDRDTVSTIYSKGNSGSRLADVHSYDHDTANRPDRAVRWANARLIAAAPDLLAALREMLEMGELFIPAKLDSPGFKRARAAILKAGGRDE